MAKVKKTMEETAVIRADMKLNRVSYPLAEVKGVAHDVELLVDGKRVLVNTDALDHAEAHKIFVGAERKLEIMLSGALGASFQVGDVERWLPAFHKP